MLRRAMACGRDFPLSLTGILPSATPDANSAQLDVHTGVEIPFLDCLPPGRSPSSTSLLALGTGPPCHLHAGTTRVLHGHPYIAIYADLHCLDNVFSHCDHRHRPSLSLGTSQPPFCAALSPNLSLFVSRYRLRALQLSVITALACFRPEARRSGCCFSPCIRICQCSRCSWSPTRTL
jgi:hypothetical protein